MSKRLPLAYLGVFFAFLLWLGTLLGHVYAVVFDVGASTLTYVETDSDGHLVVTGFTNASDSFNGLEVGDRITQIGNNKELPTDQMGFRHAAAHAQGKLTVARGSESVTIEFPLQGHLFPFASLIKNFVFGGLAVVAIIFGPRTLLVCCSAACAFTAAHIGGTAQIGPSAETTMLLALGFSINISIALPACVNLAQLLTGEQRVAFLALPWPLALVGVSLASLFFGGPVPPTQAFIHVLAADFIAFSSMLVILLRGVKSASGKQRHQINWVLGSVFLMLIWLAANWLFFSVKDPVNGPRDALALNEWLPILPALGVLMAILKADYANIDRAAAITASWALLVVGLALTFEFILEPMAGVLAASLGFNESLGQTALIVTVALTGSKLKARIQPFIESWLAPVVPTSTED